MDEGMSSVVKIYFFNNLLDIKLRTISSGSFGKCTDLVAIIPEPSEGLKIFSHRQKDSVRPRRLKFAIHANIIVF
jgi:hypothetical protein